MNAVQVDLGVTSDFLLNAERAIAFIRKYFNNERQFVANFGGERAARLYDLLNVSTNRAMVVERNNIRLIGGTRMMLSMLLYSIIFDKYQHDNIVYLSANILAANRHVEIFKEMVNNIPINEFVKHFRFGENLTVQYGPATIKFHTYEHAIVAHRVHRLFLDDMYERPNITNTGTLRYYMGQLNKTLIDVCGVGMYLLQAINPHNDPLYPGLVQSKIKEVFEVEHL